MVFFGLLFLCIGLASLGIALDDSAWPQRLWHIFCAAAGLVVVAFWLWIIAVVVG
jgi:hypothetical protein